MLLAIVQWAIISVVSWECWRILRRLAVKTDLDNVPGPASESFLKGPYSVDFHNLFWMVD